MKALVLTEAGKTPKLDVTDLPMPILGPNDVLVKVRACGLCYHDVLAMAGSLRRGIKHRVVLGHEIVGTVEGVGSAVTLMSHGDTVVSTLTNSCGHCHRCLSDNTHRCIDGQGIGHAIDGGMAEYVKISEYSLVKLPNMQYSLPLCLLGCPIGVSINALTKVAKIKSGETVVITGAGGGLGAHLVQIANVLNATVLAVTSSKEKVERIRDLGAHHVIETTGIPFSEMVMALTQDHGADVVIDTVGSPIFPTTLECLGIGGRMVSLGELFRQTVNLNLTDLIFRDAMITGSCGVSLGQIVKAYDLVSTGKLKPIVSTIVGLHEVVDAYKMMRDQKPFGRIIIEPY